MLPGIIEDMGIDDIDMGICIAGFMVRSWLDNRWCSDYSRTI